MVRTADDYVQLKDGRWALRDDIERQHLNRTPPREPYQWPSYETPKSLKVQEPRELAEVLDRCRHWLFMPDTGPLEVVLGAIAANKLPGDPVWLLLVGTPGSGKTEVLNTIIEVSDVHQVAILTEASLLSGTPKRDAKGAKGGLLREVGDFGILQVKDFGGLLSISRDARGPILAALREVYDGAWTRYVGSDGGRTLSWSGKCGLVGGATPSIDGFYAVMSILGERFSYYRLGEVPEANRAEKALIHSGHESEMRGELSEMVAGLLNNVDYTTDIEFSAEERQKLVHLAIFTTRCRSAVERDSYVNREISLIPGVESPTRLVKVLAQLLKGLQVVGVAKGRAWQLVEKTALDSMPALRQKTVLAMIHLDYEIGTSDLAAQLGYPTNTTRRTLEDLACYGIVERDVGGAGKADLWRASDWTRNEFEAATTTLPQIWEGEHTSLNNTNNIANQICGTPLPDEGDILEAGRASATTNVAASETTTLPGCPNCGSDDVRMTDWGQLLCGRCHPRPGGRDD